VLKLGADNLLHDQFLAGRGPAKSAAPRARHQSRSGFRAASDLAVDALGSCGSYRPNRSLLGSRCPRLVGTLAGVSVLERAAASSACPHPDAGFAFD
jgi:hypothetical protein